MVSLCTHVHVDQASQLSGCLRLGPVRFHLPSPLAIKKSRKNVVESRHSKTAQPLFLFPDSVRVMEKRPFAQSSLTEANYLLSPLDGAPAACRTNDPAGVFSLL